MNPSVASAGPTAIEVVHRSEELVVAAQGPLLVVTWLRSGARGSVEALHQQARALARARPGGICLLTLIGQAGGAINDDIRAAALAFLKDEALGLKLVAVVFGGSGLRATVLRSFLTGLSLLSGSRAAVRFFADEAEADAWLATADLPGLGTGDARRAAADFRAALGG